MNPRKTFLLIATALVLTTAGVLLLEFEGGDQLADDLVVATGEPGITTATSGDGGDTIPMQGAADRIGGERPGPTRRPPRQVAEGATTGIIDGRIALDTRVLGKFHGYTIEVLEDINENALREDRKPFRKVQRFAYDQIGTPFFTVEDIPFSRYGYVVRLHVAQLNGTQARVHVTREKPCGQVQLGLSPGVIFAVLLRDQRQVPRPDLHVQMMPEGDPPDRPVYRGTSNNFGQVLFRNVLRGDYKVYVGHLNAPMNIPEKVTVLPMNAVFSKGSKVSTQSAHVLVPSGAPVTVEVTDRFGYGVADAELEMHQIEVTRYFAYKAKTGPNGRHVFEHLPVGRYQLSVHKSGFGRRTQKLEVKEEDRAKVERVQLRR